MEHNIDEKKIYYTIITEAWTLLKNNLEDPDFEKVASDTHELSQKYSRTKYMEFATAMVCGVLEELNRRSTNENNG